MSDSNTHSPSMLQRQGREAFQSGQFQQASESFQELIRRDPNNADAWAWLGLAQRGVGNVEFAAAACRRAVLIDPRNAGTWNNLGTFLHELNQFGKSLEAYESAVAVRPDFPQAYAGMSAVLQALDRPDEAIRAIRRAIELGADPAMSYANLGSALRSLARLDEAIAAFREGLQRAPDSALLHSNLVYAFWYHPDYNLAAIRGEHEVWNRRHALPLAANIQPHSNDRSPDRRLRIGYVSPDFRNHVTALNLLPLFERHDHAAFHITAYSDAHQSDSTTERIKGLVDSFRPIGTLSDAPFAQLVREDGIDILVDTTTHMARNRLPAFAMKPAPVQVTYMGYPGTSGLTAIDYRLSDPYLDPEGLFESYYSEKTVRLPATYWCYTGLASGVEVSALPLLSNRFITFGCLNNFCKVSAPTLRLWARVLRALPDSRLILLAPTGEARAAALSSLKQEGIAAERIAFVGRQSHRDYLQTFHQIDICLDTIPYNGHTTSMDAFWMGIPVITLTGNTPVGRAGVSQLMNLGMPELIARTPEEFVGIALRLARDIPHLKNLRATLRVCMKRSPLMDDAAFAAGIEQAYRAMWKRWCSA